LNEGDDFFKWKERTIFMIKIHDYHLALYEDAPIVPDENSIVEKEKYDLKAKEWERSNKVSLLIMKHTISSDIKNAIPDSLYAKEYLASIEKHFKDALPVEERF
jgi:hypothetical protein